MPREVKDKTKYECAHCGQRFVKMFDHMDHVISVHDTGYKEQSERLRRSISCWHCGTRDVYPSGEDNWFYCDCGWVLPRNWVNGQLVVTEEDSEEKS